MDKDCVAMLKKMYGGDDGSTKQDLMEYGDLLTNFFGCEEKDKELLEAVDDYILSLWQHIFDFPPPLGSYKEGNTI